MFFLKKKIRVINHPYYVDRIYKFIQRSLDGLRYGDKETIVTADE
jgi:hypothetical protein